jgi:hypothetical protein
MAEAAPRMFFVGVLSGPLSTLQNPLPLLARSDLGTRVCASTACGSEIFGHWLCRLQTVQRTSLTAPEFHSQVLLFLTAPVSFASPIWLVGYVLMSSSSPFYLVHSGELAPPSATQWPALLHLIKAASAVPRCFDNFARLRAAPLFSSPRLRAKKQELEKLMPISFSPAKSLFACGPVPEPVENTPPPDTRTSTTSTAK